MMHASRPAEYFEDSFLDWLTVAIGGYGSLRAVGVDFVMVETTTSYHAPVRLGDLITVAGMPVERGRTSLRMRFMIARAGESPSVSAVTTYVCVDADARPAPLPAMLEAALAGVPSTVATAATRDAARETGSPDR
jgi:acyl-CoA thioesterase FadM